MKIKVKLHEGQEALQIIEKGEWIDLSSPKDIILNRNCHSNFKLGIAVKIPKGYEMIIAPRSSTFFKYKIMMTNGIGVIDSSYSGTNDIIRFPFYCFKDSVINKGDRVAQFRIQLSQKATIFQKLKWLFTQRIKFEYVDELDEIDRGGLGSTGV